MILALLLLGTAPASAARTVQVGVQADVGVSFGKERRVTLGVEAVGKMWFAPHDSDQGRLHGVVLRGELRPADMRVLVGAGLEAGVSPIRGQGPPEPDARCRSTRRPPLDLSARALLAWRSTGGPAVELGAVGRVTVAQAYGGATGSVVLALAPQEHPAAPADRPGVVSGAVGRVLGGGWAFRDDDRCLIVRDH